MDEKRGSVMSQIILGIDPGQFESGVCFYDGKEVTDYEILNNEVLLKKIYQHRENIALFDGNPIIAMEEFKNYGMGIGQTTIDSIFWSGRFYQAWLPMKITLIPRKTIATNICGVARAGNTNIRHALIDSFTELYAGRLGGGKIPIKGIKKDPGPFYGMSDHMFSALAVAVTYYDLHIRKDG